VPVTAPPALDAHRGRRLGRRTEASEWLTDAGWRCAISACAVSLVTLRTPRAQNFPRHHIVPRPGATSTSAQLLAELVNARSAVNPRSPDEAIRLAGSCCVSGMSISRPVDVGRACSSASSTSRCASRLVEENSGTGDVRRAPNALPGAKRLHNAADQSHLRRPSARYRRQSRGPQKSIPNRPPRRQPGCRQGRRTGSHRERRSARGAG
jgi:hypothetical protein